MSGGVDSSLAAFLLKEKGYQVVGISMKLWDFKEVGGESHPDGRCCSLEALNDARAVCQMMGIPHYVVDMGDDFKKEVISNFVEEYIKGRTPNPCIICNTKIKWESLWRKAKSLGAKFISTGHYARILYDEKLKRFLLLKGIDSDYIQRFPNGNSQSPSLTDGIEWYPLMFTNFFPFQVKDGTWLNLFLCFVTNDDYPRFIKEWVDNKGQGARGKGQGKKIQPGSIFNLKGEKIGEHEGIPFYTIGQRRGLGVAVGKPLYVVRIDP